ncbi:hypothetical protein [Microbacterium sp. 3J1]|uniref:hypothetical protein n=1 Tax=Microbacterium sp. 3J1 TaxID=861269 RepID=UPI000B2728C3|nr:hypothetical protein [Microbacterium sp. 3J1]
MSNPTPPILPLPDGGDDQDIPQQEVDGGTVLDTDADADQIDGAEADRLAAEEPRDDDAV